MGVVSLPIGSRAEFKYVHMTSKGDFLDWVEGPEGAGEVPDIAWLPAWLLGGGADPF